MKNPVKKLILALALSLPVAPGLASAETIAITNGKLHTMGPMGTIDSGTLLIEGNMITAVGTDVAIPQGARIIDAGGKPVTPGFFDALTSIGLSEVTLSAGIEDDEARTSRFVIAPDASFAFNPDNTFVPSTRIEGVTRAAISMKITKQIFAGRGAIVHLGYGPDHISRPRAFIYADLGERGGTNAGGSRAVAWVELYAALRETDNLTTQPRNHWQGGIDKPLYSHIDLEALQPAVQGEIPFIVHVNRLADIRRVIDLKQARPAMKIVIHQGDEAWRSADDLAEADIPVLIHPYDNLPASFNEIGATMENAARLRAAGVKIAISSWGNDQNNYMPRLLPQLAGIAVANGLDWDDALTAVTRAPAEIYGISDRVGRLTEGMEADVVIWSGDPFEVMDIAAHVIIQGQEIPLISRQTRLRDRYRTIGSQ